MQINYSKKGHAMADIDIKEIQEITPQNGPKITIIGVGGGGSNMVTDLYNQGAHEDLKIIIANTDVQALNASSVPLKIQLGAKTTSGLGAGADDEVGEKAAQESRDEIRKSLEGSDMVIICVGLGGGTGTGAAPVVAKIAKELGSLTVLIATKPFLRENKPRQRRAESGLESLSKICDSFIVVPNQKILSVISKNTGAKQAYTLINKVLINAANGLSSVILNNGADDINVDFADIKKTISGQGLALMSIGEASGDNACIDAVRNAINSPLLDNLSIANAKGAIVCYDINPNYPLLNLDEATQFIREAINNEEAEVIEGTHYDEEKKDDFVRVTIIATGFSKPITSSLHNESTTTTNTTNSTKEATTTKKEPQNEFDLSQLLLVSGGDIEAIDLDKPTFMRHQKD